MDKSDILCTKIIRQYFTEPSLFDLLQPYSFVFYFFVYFVHWTEQRPVTEQTCFVHLTEEENIFIFFFKSDVPFSEQNREEEKTMNKINK